MIQCCHTSVPFQLLGVTESPRALAVLAHRFPRASLEPDGQMDGTKASQVCWFGKGRYFMHKHIFVYMYCMYWTNTSIAKKWLARYMKGGPDVVWRCRWLKQIKRVHIYTYIHYILMALNYQLLFWRYTKLLTKKASITCRCVISRLSFQLHAFGVTGFYVVGPARACICPLYLWIGEKLYITLRSDLEKRTEDIE